MADYKHRAGSKKKRPASCSHGQFFFGGLVAGLFLAGLAWLQLGPRLSSHEIPGIATKPQQSREPQQTTTAPKPNFEFYTILPEMEVVIPDEEIVAPEPPVTPRKPAPSENRQASRESSGGGYILQMGSFRKHQDADRLKAKLALIGIEASIQRVSINNRDTYHRVRSGPYRSKSQLNSTRKLAKQNGITSLVIKLKE